MSKGAVGRLGMNGRLVYVENVTRHAAYLLSLPDQHDTDLEADQRYLGPIGAITTSPHLDFYTMDDQALSDRNRDFLTELRTDETLPYVVTPGHRILHGSHHYSSGDEILLTYAERLRLGKSVAREDEIVIPEIPKKEDPNVLRLACITSEGLGPRSKSLYDTIDRLGNPTLDELRVAFPKPDLEQFLLSLISLKKVQWVAATVIAATDESPS